MPGPPLPAIHFVQMLVLGGANFLGLDQQGNCWMGVLRPQDDGTFSITWAAVDMVFPV